MPEFLGREDAVRDFRPFAPSRTNTPMSAIEANLREHSISNVELGIPINGFQEISDQYAVCIDEHPELLELTGRSKDSDGVPEDGHVRKEIGHNLKGMQISDPKNLFHFNNDLREWWEFEGRFDALDGPKAFNEFMEHGFELQSQLVRSAKNIISLLDHSYGKMSELYFPANISRVTFRLLRYDGYDIHNDDGKLIARNHESIAKPHYDRGGMTIQAYSSAPGFWIQPDPTDGSRRRETDPKQYPEYGPGHSQVFFGTQHKIIYGSKDNIRSLYHGVDREYPIGAEHMPARTAAIAFVDPPLHRLKVTSRDTQPDRADVENLTI